MKKAKIKITMIDKLGNKGCRYGHKIGDSFDFDTQRGNVCPMVMHVAFPYIDIMRYGGNAPKGKDGLVKFCCPDVESINVFKLEIVDDILEEIKHKNV